MSTTKDLVEKKFEAYIKNSLPKYNQLWEKVYLTDKKLQEKEAFDKKRFGEYIYTCLHNIISMKLIADKYYFSKIKVEGDGDLDIDQYFELMRDLVAFHAYIGQNCDIIHKMIPEVVIGFTGDDDLKDFMKSRNNIIHGHRLPFKLNPKGVFSIPRLKNDIEENNKFFLDIDNKEDKLSWKKGIGNIADFQELGTYYGRTLQEFTQKIDQAFGGMLKKVPENWGKIRSLYTPVGYSNFISGSQNDPSMK